MFYHFEYTSGENPYIAFTAKERDRVKRRHNRRGEKVLQVVKTENAVYYRVHDKEVALAW
jgi:hypothetical protein